MLFSIFNSFGENSTLAIISLILMIPALLIALTVHEYAHGRMAFALGDKTAMMMGRLSLNPLHHLDPFGAIMLLLFGFGFAKPVPVNMRNVTKVNYKLGTFLISIAGVLANFILAFIGVFGLLVTNTVTLEKYGISASFLAAYGITDVSPLAVACYLFFYYFALLNIGLAVFNLIPIPPLDGSRILTLFLPAKAQVWFYRNEHLISIVILILFITDILDKPLIIVRSFIFDGMVSLISLLPFIH